MMLKKPEAKLSPLNWDGTVKSTNTLGSINCGSPPCGDVEMHLFSH